METKVFPPKRNNNGLKDLNEVLNEETVDDPVPPETQINEDFLKKLQDAENQEEKARLLQEYLYRQADEVLKRKKSYELPYPSFDPTDPDPDFPYTGLLYRLLGSKDKRYIEPINQKTFDDIAYKYGAGNYELRPPSGQSGPRFIIPIDKMLVKRVRDERKDMDEDYFEDIPVQKEPPKDESNEIRAMLMKMQEDKSKTLENLLVTVLAKDTGASGTALNQSYKDGFEAGKSAMTMTLAEKDRQINALEREKDEWKAKAEALQVELGQLPDNELEPEPEPKPEKKPGNKFEEFVSAIGTGIGETLLKKFTNEETQQNQPKQIEDKISKMSNEEKIKAIILGAFKDNLPAGQTAKAIQQFITGQIKTAFDMFSTEQIVPFLVNSHFPGASGKLVEYLTAVVKILKG